MSNQDNGGPAFPRSAGDYNGSKHGNAAQGGMTLRDYFAAKAMAAIIQTWPQMDDRPESEDQLLSLTAKDAYKFADAMLKARQQ